MTTASVPRSPMWVALLPWLLALLVLLAYGGAYLARVRQPGGALAFAVLGTANTPGNHGYDGQYYYRIAADPLAGRRGLDRPAYRYQRILYPLVARVLALGARARVATALVLLNAAAIGLGVLCVGVLLRRNGASPLYAVVVALYAGQVGSFWRDLAEPLSFALVGAALLCMPWLWEHGHNPYRNPVTADPDVASRPIWERGRLARPWAAYRLDGDTPSKASRDEEPPAEPSGAAAPRIWPAALLLLAATMTKETALLFVAPIALNLALRRAWPAFRTLALVVAVPYLLWQAALWLAFGQPGVAGADHPPLAPLGGLAGARGSHMLFFDLCVVVIPALLCLALAGVGIWRLWQAARRETLPTRDWHVLLWRVAGDAPTLFVLANLVFVLWLPARSYADLWASARNADGLVLAALIHPAFVRTRLRWPLLALWGASAPLLWLQ